jgi:hypothetical protein
VICYAVISLLLSASTIVGPQPASSKVALDDENKTIARRLDGQVIASKQYSGDLLFLTSKNLVRVTPKDKIVWTIPFDNDQARAGGDLMDLPGGEMIGFRYGQASDSGVSLICFNPSKGKQTWNHYCQGLGVPHSEYRHRATVTVRGDKLRVISNGSSGMFVELLDLKTGRTIERTQTKRQ